jgi:ABC-2 type transport system ATP-binding protein
VVTSTSGIVVAGLVKRYGRAARRALDDVSLTVAPGEAIGIIGPNGAGKTTFFGCLLGHLRPSEGTITIDGRSPDAMSVKREVGFLPERLLFDRWMSGERFLTHHHALAGLPPATRSADVVAALERVGLEAAAGRKALKAYSRGMLQRIGLAQALLAKPRWLFLDEPASGVDPAGVLLFRRLLAEARAGGTTIVLNSHQLDQVERICDRVAFLREGKVEAIEVLHAGAEAKRHMRVRFAVVPVGAPDPLGTEALARAAVAAQGELIHPPAAAREAVFAVADDAGATRLLAGLLAAGMPVVEARSEEGRLERLFLEGPPGAAPMEVRP